MSGTNAVAKMAAPKEEAWHYLKTFQHDKNTLASSKSACTKQEIQG